MKKKCKVITLVTTDDNAPLCKHPLTDKWVAGIQMGYIKHHLYIASDDPIKIEDWYILVDPLVNRTKVHKVVYQATENRLEFIKRMREKNSDCSFHKIIATTNPTLELPSIPRDFVGQYYDGIDEVNVEYIANIWTWIDPNQGHSYGFPKPYCGTLEFGDTKELMGFLEEEGYPIEEYDYHRQWEEKIHKPRISRTYTAPNTVTDEIILSKVKKTWTRDEIEFVLHYTSGIDNQAAAKVLAVLDDVEQDMKDFEEEMKGEEKLNEWKSFGLST